MVNESDNRALLGLLEGKYASLREIIQKKFKSIKKGSVLIHLIDASSNNRFYITSESAFPSTELSPSTVQSLKDAGYLKDAPNNLLVLTFKGIAEYEMSKSYLTEDSLYAFFDDKYLSAISKESTRGLDFRSKTLLMALIGARAFSNEVPMNLNDKKICDMWQEIMRLASFFLVSLKIGTEADINSFYSNPPGEHPVNWFVSNNTSNLPKMSDSMYSFKRGEKTYWLDVLDSGKVSEDKLRFIISKIFDKQNLSYLEVERVYEFLKDIAYNHSIGIYSDKTNPFLTSENNKTIRAALL